VRWNAGYVPEDDDAPEVAGVEAATAIDAVARLREVVGTETDVLYVIPNTGGAEQGDADTYEAFLHDPNAASQSASVLNRCSGTKFAAVQLPRR
jgi:hypothetical protein